MMVVSPLSILHQPVVVVRLGASPIAADPKVYCLSRFTLPDPVDANDRQNANERKVHKQVGVMQDKSSATCSANFATLNSMLLIQMNT
jgi:hypothetical protein